MFIRKCQKLAKKISSHKKQNYEPTHTSVVNSLWWQKNTLIWTINITYFQLSCTKYGEACGWEKSLLYNSCACIIHTPKVLGWKIWKNSPSCTRIIIVDWVLWHINLCRLSNAKSIFIQLVLFQMIQFSMSHHHVVLLAWISLTLSCHPSLSSITPGRSSMLHPVSAQSCCI